MRYVTPEEAAAKWCPFVRQHFGHGETDVAANREKDEGRNCIGPACMAWRWRDWLRGKGVGFCGLVGDPYPLDTIEQRQSPLGPNGLPRRLKEIDDA